MKPLSLDIGAGSEGRGDINTDLRPIPGVDVVCDALALPFRKGSFSQVKMNHVLEHFTYPEALLVLEETGRVLSADGTVEVWVPNFQSFGVLAAWLTGGVDRANADVPQVYSPLCGQQDYRENTHKSQWTAKLLKIYAEKAGLEVVRLRSTFADHSGIFVVLYLVLRLFPGRKGFLHLVARRSGGSL